MKGLKKEMEGWGRKCLSLAFAFCAVLSGVQAQTVISGTPVAAGMTVAGQIVNARTGRGIPDVPVTDGYTYVETDKNGVYQMKAHEMARFVYYSLPSGFKTVVDNQNVPRFFAPLNHNSAFQRHDFRLEPQRNFKDFTLLFVTDVQTRFHSDWERVRRETVPDIEYTLSKGMEEGRYKNIIGLNGGDVIFDLQELWQPTRDALSGIRLKDGTCFPMYTTPGNHDHFNASHNQYESTENYCRYFGPTEYSFNIGDVHVVSLDDVQYNGIKGKGIWSEMAYNAGITDEQMEWLRQDLARVKDKEKKMVILMTHIPVSKGQAKGGSAMNYDKHHDDVLSALTPFYEANIMTGHTHWAATYMHDKFKTRSGDPVREFIHAAVSGWVWRTNMNVDGSPLGYTIYRIGGKRIQDWQYKSVGQPMDYQMRVYNGGQRWSDFKGKDDYAFPDSLKNCFVANIWKSDGVYWKVYLDVNGKRLPMRQVGKPIGDPAVNALLKNGWSDGYTVAREHWWYIEAPSGNPENEKNWEVVAVYTAPSGKQYEYRCHQLQTTFSGMNIWPGTYKQK